ncbi:MAG: hypothetical protein RL641_223 [Candidatus Parcubacteria bacterium]|jgi:hypothetical protein
MTEGEKPFVGDQDFHKYQKQALDRKEQFEKWKKQYGDQLSDLEGYLVFENESLIWLENEIKEKEKEGKDTSVDKIILEKQKADIQNTEQMIVDWKKYIAEFTLDTIAEQKIIEEFDSYQERIKQWIIDKKPGQEN